MENWKTLIPILEKYDAYPDFIAECVYAYIVNYGMEPPQDSKLLNELVRYLERNE
jgi:hypothetical protein